MFVVRPKAVGFRICCWGMFDLSYLGRVHVANQVLANSLYFHASFMLPPPELLAEIVECMDRFVMAKGHCLGGGAAGPPAPHAQQGCGVPALGPGWLAAGRHPCSGVCPTGKGGGYALASPPPRLEGPDAAGISTVPACPWAGGASQ